MDCVNVLILFLYPFPKGSTIAINFYGIMRTGIQQPDDFIPDRWSDDNPDKEKLKVSIVSYVYAYEFMYECVSIQMHICIYMHIST
jgi:cytochrome P450